MQGTISHDRREETPEAKARWFQSLSLQERMEILCSVTELALTTNPHIAENKHAQPIKGRVRVLVASKTDLIAAKKAAGRAVDREDVRLLELPDAPTD